MALHGFQKLVPEMQELGRQEEGGTLREVDGMDLVMNVNVMRSFDRS